MSNTDELTKKILKVLNDPNSFENYDDQKGMFVVLVNGKRVKMSSGKNIWTSTGAAKNALRCHMDNLIYKKIINNFIQREDGSRDYKTSAEIVKNIQSEWINKHVNVIPFNSYLIVRSKIKK